MLSLSEKVSCPVCGTDIPKDADKCPECGLDRSIIDIADTEPDVEIQEDDLDALLTELDEEIGERLEEEEKEELEEDIYDNVFDTKDRLEIEEPEVEEETKAGEEQVVFECGNCGEDVPESASKCPYCGAVFEEEEIEGKEEKKQEFDETFEKAQIEVKAFNSGPVTKEGLEKYLEDAEKAAEMGDFESGIELATKAISATDQLKIFVDKYKEAESTIRDLKREGGDVNKFNRKLDEAEGYVQEGKVLEGISRIEDLNQELEKRFESQKRKKEITRKINQLKEKLNQLLSASSELEIPLDETRDMISEALWKSKQGNVEEALQNLEKAQKEASEVLTQRISRVLVQLEEQQSSVQDEERRENLGKYIQKSREAMENDQYVEATQMLKKAEDISEKLKRSVEGMDFNRLKRMVDLSESIGIDCSKEVDYIIKADDAYNRGYVRNGKRYLKRAKDNLFSKVPSKMDTIMNEDMDTLKEAKKKGVDVSRPLTHLKRASFLSKNNKYLLALEHLKKLRDFIEEEIEEEEEEVEPEIPPPPPEEVEKETESIEGGEEPEIPPPPPDLEEEMEEKESTVEAVEKEIPPPPPSEEKEKEPSKAVEEPPPPGEEEKKPMEEPPPPPPEFEERPEQEEPAEAKEIGEEVMEETTAEQPPPPPGREEPSPGPKGEPIETEKTEKEELETDIPPPPPSEEEEREPSTVVEEPPTPSEEKPQEETPPPPPEEEEIPPPGATEEGLETPQEVEEAPSPEEEVEEVPYPPGRVYLIKEDSPDKGYEIFKNSTEGEEKKGLTVTRQYPIKIQKKYDIEESSIIWLSGVNSKDSYNPRELDKITEEIEDFMEEEEGTVLFHGFEYLVENNDFDSILEVIQNLKEALEDSSCIMLVTVNPAEFDDEEMERLEDEIDEIIEEYE